MVFETLVEIRFEAKDMGVYVAKLKSLLDNPMITGYTIQTERVRVTENDVRVVDSFIVKHGDK